MALPLAARGAGTDRPLGAYRLDVGSWMVPAAISPRVMLLLLDGASLDYILPAAAEGRLPNYGRILDSSAAMHLATLRPTQPGPVWATVATGKYPSKHGVRSAATYEVRAGLEPIELLTDYCFARALIYLGFLSATPNTSAALRARPLWSILSLPWPIGWRRRLAADLSGAAGPRVPGQRSLPPCDGIAARSRRRPRGLSAGHPGISRQRRHAISQPGATAACRRDWPIRSTC